MSQAFVREGEEDQWLEDVGPSLKALKFFLTRQNNNIPVTERSVHKNAEGREVFLMSNGLSYVKDAAGKWQIINP